MMRARVAGVPMPSVSVRIFLMFGRVTNLPTAHMAAMSDASVKGLGGSVSLSAIATSTAVTLSPCSRRGSRAALSLSFS